VHDIVIRGGDVADGTGAEPRPADVAIDGDRITAVGEVPERGRREVDARDRLVTPGFVDVHTHLDAQLFWDPAASSSCWHGVTTVVLGNCGVTFAPVRPGQEGYLAGMMEAVEDIPADTIMAGLDWGWESYADFLRALDGRPLGVNAGGMIGHAALRYYVMGERSLDDAPAGDDDVARMAALVGEAVDAGALGFSTSRSFLHTVPDGRPIPGTYARPEELAALAGALAERGRGTIEVVPRIGERDGPERENSVAEMAWMETVSRAAGRPLTFTIMQSDRRPGLWAWVMERVAEARARGADLRPQTSARGTGIVYGLVGRTPYDDLLPGPSSWPGPSRSGSPPWPTRLSAAGWWRRPANPGRCPARWRPRTRTSSTCCPRGRPATTSRPATAWPPRRPAGTRRRPGRSSPSRWRRVGAASSTTPCSTRTWTRWRRC
jgi:N-acyl-D-amino-acid deacylase